MSMLPPLTRESPAAGAVAVTPNDDAALPVKARALYVGAAGNIAVEMENGDVVTFVDVSVGYHPLTVVRVLSTGTTASSIVALY